MKYTNHANRGKSFERQIQIMHNLYWGRGQGLIQKIAVPTKIISGRIIREKSTIDFLGALENLPIAFDAKEESSTNFNLKRIYKDQLKALQGFYYGGSRAFILLNMKVLNGIYIIPYQNIVNLHRQEIKSVSRDYLTAHESLKVCNSNQLPDYLKILKGK